MIRHTLSKEAKHHLPEFKNNTLNPEPTKNIEKPKDFLCKRPDLEIDTDISQLSSRKLWQILRVNQIPACELEHEFVQQVQDELIARDDFDEGKAWSMPH